MDETIDTAHKMQQTSNLPIGTGTSRFAITRGPEIVGSVHVRSD